MSERSREKRGVQTYEEERNLVERDKRSDVPYIIPMSFGTLNVQFRGLYNSLIKRKRTRVKG